MTLGVNEDTAREDRMNYLHSHRQEFREMQSMSSPLTSQLWMSFDPTCQDLLVTSGLKQTSEEPQATRNMLHSHEA